MSRDANAGRTGLAVDSTTPSPEQMKAKEMFKRVIAVAELLSKSDQVQKQSRFVSVVGAQKTQKQQTGVS